METEKIRKDFPVLEKLTYLDSACMSLKPRPVMDKVREYYEDYPACGGRSSHSLAKAVTHETESARKEVASFLGCKTDEVVFTRNTTEGINLVSRSLDLDGFILTSDREHNSNLLPWLAAKSRGIEHRVVPSLSDETFDMEAFSQAVKGAALVSVVHASNIDGYVMPVKEIIKIAHEEGALAMLDGAQSAPHLDFSLKKLGADLFSCSGHKMLGPTGTGVLFGKRDILESMHPYNIGGETVSNSTYETFDLLKPPQKFEAGLQHYSGIAGLGEACRYIRKLGKGSIEKHEKALTRQCMERLQGLGCDIVGVSDPALKAGVVSFNVKGLGYHEVALMLNEKGIMLRSGQHCCHSWFNSRSIRGSVRASLYLYTSVDDIEILVSNLEKIIGLVK